MMGKCMMNLVFSKRSSGQRPSKVKPRCKQVNQPLVELGKLGGTRRNWGWLRGRPKKKVRSAVVIEMIMGVINLQGEGVTRTQKEVGMDIGLQEMTSGTVIMSEIEEIEDVGEMTGRVTETCTATRTKIGTETGIENVAGSKTVTGVVVARIETGIGSIRIGSGQGNENVYESVTDSWISSNHLTSLSLSILCFSVFPLGWGNRMLFPSSVWFTSSVKYGNLTFSEVKVKCFACGS